MSEEIDPMVLIFQYKCGINIFPVPSFHIILPIKICKWIVHILLSNPFQYLNCQKHIKHIIQKDIYFENTQYSALLVPKNGTIHL